MFNILEINELLKQGFSVTRVAKELGVPKTTLLRNLKKEGYVLKDEDGIKFYELFLIAQDKKENRPQKVSTVETKELQDRIELIRKSLSGIVHNFVCVACELNYIYVNSLFKENGFDNIVDFANVEFGLERTKTYSFLKLYDKCIDSSTNLLKEEYSKFNYSQLVEILYLPGGAEKEVASDMTVRDIRQIKNQSKENKEGDGRKTFVEAEFEHVEVDKKIKWDTSAITLLYKMHNNTIKNLETSTDSDDKIRLDVYTIFKINMDAAKR
jgi:hypothetical protein